MAAEGVNVLAVPQPGLCSVSWVLSQHGTQWEQGPGRQPHVSGYSDYSWTAQQILLSVVFFLHKQALAQGWLFADMYNPFYSSWVCLGSCCCEALG